MLELSELDRGRLLGLLELWSIQVYKDYMEAEVRLEPPSVQAVWAIGRQLMDKHDDTKRD
jgi:hypothetical protein